MVKNKSGTLVNPYRNFEKAPVAVVVFKGEEMVVEFVNELALPLLKRPLDQALGFKINEVFGDLFPSDSIQKIYDRCFRREETFVLEDRQLNFILSGNLQIAWFEI